MAYLIGIDVGSSSVKAAVLDIETGACVGDAFAPKEELVIESPQAGFAEQDPQTWYDNARIAVREAMTAARITGESVEGIGISYQMHGLVCVDKAKEVLRPAIIWCDSRAVSYGQAAFDAIGGEKCLAHLLNSPGNFTAMKLAWVKENQPEIYAKIDKVMLPGDWLAMKLTGEAQTTASGLSEGIFWDFKNNQICDFLLEQSGFSPDLIPEVVPTFSVQAKLTKKAADDFGLHAGTPVAYRAGDQPNNALSLNVLQPGEIAATAGTSGVVYGVTDQVKYDPQSRVNTFLHVNHTAEAPRLGVLLCINGTGIFNSWTRRMLGGLSYPEMNKLAEAVPVGSEGLTALPFGNGAERVLCNRNPGASMAGLDFNRHGRGHLCRALQEGIVFSFQYGIELMKPLGLDITKIRAGKANMFLSPLFCETLAGVSGAGIELYETDGSLGAARGAGVGAGVYGSLEEAFSSLKQVGTIEPKSGAYSEAYERWKSALHAKLS
ncbi:FGGY family carbohydrate kinase [Pelagicoccus sp. SDUM812003]|uniref:xylulokinase n=1 Tax=Pelagicoccus sp. SDUM812003 TaxID=3041267 RepID=UPI00280F1CD3|nr:FGGY family carbohydrate kinase [Pelagicoccus sp. SDUM812003]MDQ8203087.1 FGGY family carbohydrate kinase [Pelagicoccus sp. SDUM812003]